MTDQEVRTTCQNQCQNAPASKDGGGREANRQGSVNSDENNESILTVGFVYLCHRGVF